MAMRQDARTINQRGVILVGGPGDGKTSVVKLLTEGYIKEDPVATSFAKRYCCEVKYHDMVINLTDTVGMQSPKAANQVIQWMTKSALDVNCIFYVWKHHRRGFTDWNAKNCCAKLSEAFGDHFRLIVTHAPEVKPERVSQDLVSVWGEDSHECKMTRFEIDPRKIICIENCNYSYFQNDGRKDLAAKDADEAYRKLTGLIHSMDDRYSNDGDDYRNENVGGCSIF